MSTESAADDGGRYDDRERCQAIANATGEQCRRARIRGLAYCPDHRHLHDPDLDAS